MSMPDRIIEDIKIIPEVQVDDKKAKFTDLASLARYIAKQNPKELKTYKISITIDVKLNNNAILNNELNKNYKYISSIYSELVHGAHYPVYIGIKGKQLKYMPQIIGAKYGLTRLHDVYNKIFYSVLDIVSKIFSNLIREYEKYMHRRGISLHDVIAELYIKGENSRDDAVGIEVGAVYVCLAGALLSLVAGSILDYRLVGRELYRLGGCRIVRVGTGYVTLYDIEPVVFVDAIVNGHPIRVVYSARTVLDFIVNYALGRSDIRYDVKRLLESLVLLAGSPFEGLLTYLPLLARMEYPVPNWLYPVAQAEVKENTAEGVARAFLDVLEQARRKLVARAQLVAKQRLGVVVKLWPVALEGIEEGSMDGQRAAERVMRIIDRVLVDVHGCDAVSSGAYICRMPLVDVAPLVSAFAELIDSAPVRCASDKCMVAIRLRDGRKVTGVLRRAPRREGINTTELVKLVRDAAAAAHAMLLSSSDYTELVRSGAVPYSVVVAASIDKNPEYINSLDAEKDIRLGVGTALASPLSSILGIVLNKNVYPAGYLIKTRYVDDLVRAKERLDSLLTEPVFRDAERLFRAAENMVPPVINRASNDLVIVSTVRRGIDRFGDVVEMAASWPGTNLSVDAALSPLKYGQLTPDDGVLTILVVHAVSALPLEQLARVVARAADAFANTVIASATKKSHSGIELQTSRRSNVGGNNANVPA